MAKDVRILRKTLEEGVDPEGKTLCTAGGSSQQEQKRYDWYTHQDGFRWVPLHWAFPQLALSHMYVYWHCGDGDHFISPMKKFRGSDVAFLGKRALTSLREVARLMTIIDDESKRKGTPPQRVMSIVEANTCFAVGRSGLGVNPVSPTGRVRDLGLLRWQSVIKYLYRK